MCVRTSIVLLKAVKGACYRVTRFRPYRENLYHFDASGKSRNFNNLRVPTNSRDPGKSMNAWFETKFMDSRFPLMQP